MITNKQVECSLSKCNTYNLNCRQGNGKGGAWILHVRERQDSYTLEHGVCESYGTNPAVACLVRLSSKAAGQFELSQTNQYYLAIWSYYTIWSFG